MATGTENKQDTTELAPVAGSTPAAAKVAEAPAPPLSRTEAVVHCAAIAAAFGIAIVSLLKGQNDLAKWSLGAIAVIAGVKLADFAGMRRGRSLGSIVGPGATLAFAAVTLLSSLQVGCPGNITRSCTTPNVYSCVNDIPRYCSSDRRLTAIGDVPCSELGLTCVVLGGGTASLCVSPQDAAAPTDAAVDATTDSAD